MKKETSSSAKATTKPKSNEKKASAKKKADSNPDAPAIKCTKVTCQPNEQVTFSGCPRPTYLGEILQTYRFPRQLYAKDNRPAARSVSRGVVLARA